jgi:uncharacterized protein
MGPTNIALVKLYQADQKLREAQSRLDAVSKNVRIQERKSNELSERLRLGQTTLREQQSQAAQLDLDLKTREVKIERLRTQQTNAKNNREYQAFLVEINTEKLDKGKVEEELLNVMTEVEKLQAETKELSGLLDAEKEKLESMRKEINDRVKQLQAEVDSLRPSRESAAAAVPKAALDAFERLADRFEGEAMSALTKPDRRREEYACNNCNMDLVTDVYNKLHSRDELIFCPSCKCILYIPDDLPIELAVNKVKEKKEPRIKTSNLKAAVNRQTAAEDVIKSITLEEDDDDSSGDEQTAG